MISLRCLALRAHKHVLYEHLSLYTSKYRGQQLNIRESWNTVKSVKCVVEHLIPKLKPIGVLFEATLNPLPFLQRRKKIKQWIVLCKRLGVAKQWN